MGCDVPAYGYSSTSGVSIHAPRVGCDSNRWSIYAQYVVSIHAPRVGCDRDAINQAIAMLCFNSRTPCGVRLSGGGSRLEDLSFNSRTPCGVRPRYSAKQVTKILFQFTHPVWGATCKYSGGGWSTDVSIHAPRVGCDRYGRSNAGWLIKFQFTHPVWGATGSG